MSTSQLRRRLMPAAFGAALVLALTLAACAPRDPGAGLDPTPFDSGTPTPSATPTVEAHAPAIGELVLTSDGMGTLVIGQAPPEAPELRMLEQDPAACSDEKTGFDAGVEPGDPEALRWVPISAYAAADGYPRWSVDVHDGILWRIDLRDGSIPTDRGIRIGDSRADAVAAYPDAPVSDQLMTDVLVVPGDHGVMHIEIARDPGGDLTGYWGDLVDTVVFIRTVDLDGGVFTVAASENIAGGCL